jgi:hypothetical protein
VSKDLDSPKTVWDETLRTLRAAPRLASTKDRNLSGVVSATSSLSNIVSETSNALKAALIQNEQLKVRNAELEVKLGTVVGSVDDTDTGEIERALSNASLALAARRQDISAMEEEIAALKVDNSVLLETQVRLETALVAFTAEGATGEDMPVVLAQLMKQLSAEIIEQRCVNENLKQQF